MFSLNAKENTLENYKKLIHSSKAYIKYLESFGDQNSIQEECDLDCLKVGYATFALLLWKDEYIKKDQAKNLSTILVDQLLEVYITNIAKKNADGKWQIGEITFDSNLDVVDKVRNKLAHGDFAIDKNQIHFEINGQEGTIMIPNLVAFATHLGNDWEKMRQYGENTTTVFRNPNMLEGIDIQTAEDLENALQKISYIEIKDKPQILRTRTLEYMQMAYFLKDKVMKEIQRFHPVENITEEDHAKRLLDSVGMKASIREMPVQELDRIEQVKGMYLSKLPYLKDADPYFQQKYLIHWLHEASRDEMTKKSICYGLLSNQVYLKELEENSKKNVTSIVENSPYGETLIVMNERAIIAAYMASFYFTYIYGLDNVLNMTNREYLPDIVENKAFDFSELDLSEINPQDIVIEHEYPEFQEQIDKLKSDLVITRGKIEKVQENYNRVSQISGKEDVQEELKKLLQELEEEYKRIERLIQKCEWFMKTKYDSYKWNRSVIEHLRNSIAHGNVYLDLFRGNYTTDDAVFKFQDVHYNQKSFDLELTAKQFNSLTSTENIKCILKFLGDHEEKQEEKEIQQMI